MPGVFGAWNVEGDVKGNRLVIIRSYLLISHRLQSIILRTYFLLIGISLEYVELEARLIGSDLSIYTNPILIENYPTGTMRRIRRLLYLRDWI